MYHLLQYHRKLPIITALLAAVIIVAGCFDYREEIWINADLSGTIAMDITIGEVFVSLYEQSGETADIFTKEGIQKRVAEIDGVNIINAESYTVEDNRRIQISLKFSSIDALRNVFRTARGTRFLGDIALVPDPDGMKYTRTVSLTDSTITSLAMYDEKLDQRFWVSRVHFPGYVSETNAPERNVDEKTQAIVTWGYAIDLLTREPRTMEAIFSEPSAFKIMPALGAGFVFLIVLAGLYKILGGLGAGRRKRR